MLYGLSGQRIDTGIMGEGNNEGWKVIESIQEVSVQLKLFLNHIITLQLSMLLMLHLSKRSSFCFKKKLAVYI